MNVKTQFTYTCKLFARELPVEKKNCNSIRWGRSLVFSLLPILDMVPYDLSLKKKKKSEQAENISIKADSLLIVVSYILFKSK